MGLKRIRLRGGREIQLLLPSTLTLAATLSISPPLLPDPSGAKIVWGNDGGGGMSLRCGSKA
jgi:hypothetical protein